MTKTPIDVEVKASLQLPSIIREIDSTYPKDYKPAKKDKDNINWDH